jgi:hypothetical protein
MAVVVPAGIVIDTSFSTGSPPKANVRWRNSTSPRIASGDAGAPAATCVSATPGSTSSTSSMRFQDAMPRCQRFVTQPKAIIGHASIAR